MSGARCYTHPGSGYDRLHLIAGHQINVSGHADLLYAPGHPRFAVTIGVGTGSGMAAFATATIGLAIFILQAVNAG